jgi:hypothetical protein
LGLSRQILLFNAAKPVTRALFLALLLSLGAWSAEAQTAVPREFIISYSARARGLDVGLVNYAFSGENNSYSGTSQRRLTGLARTFFGASQDFDYAAQGHVDAGGVHPCAYQHRDFGRRHRLVRVSFDGDTVTTVATPPMGMGHPAATAAQKAGAIDQISLLLQMLVATGAPCEHTYRVFMDGRSSFDLTLTAGGKMRVRFPGYEGDVDRCSVAFQPIAGCSDPQQPARLTFLFAHVGPYAVPVSIEMPTDAAGIVQLQVRSFRLGW